METSSTLRAEHDALLLVLEQLRLAADAAADGKPVPKDVFEDIAEFLTVFVGQCHEAKEELIIPRLTLGGLERRLIGEHRGGQQMVQAYASAVASYVPGDRASAANLQQAASAYSTLQSAHAASENEQFLPAIDQQLADQDGELVQAFERIETEQIGAGTHERLHAMVGTLAGRIAPFATPAG